jgi:hypothetical protein
MYTYKRDNKEVEDAHITLNKIGKMVRFNTSPVFKSVDLDDAGPMRRAMAALDYYLANRVLNNATPDLRAIQEAV